MKVYYDPSFLIALYIPESLSPSAQSWVEEQRQPLVINAIQELEFRNAVRQKVARKEISEGEMTRALRLFDDDYVGGRIRRRSVPWEAVFVEAETISARVAKTQSCRTFDLLHVAVARTSGIE